MKKKKIWMAIVSHENEVSFSRACLTERNAEKAIVGYLQKEEGFDGNNFNEACFWIGENDLRLDLMLFPMEPDEYEEIQSLFSMAPPPVEKGLFRVIYVIDVGAGNVIEAAMNAYEMMSASDSLPPVLEVIDSQGNKIKIDLHEHQQEG